jgi:DNA polymerase-3 subunit delta'
VSTNAILAGTEHHPHARAVLGAAVPPGGDPSHAYLLHGPAGTGKRTAARAFAAELLVEGAADPAGARARVVSGAHPDLTWVRPSGAHELLVDDVKPVIASAALTPFEARRRVFVIERADTMNDEAANRLLKTLEEPASFVHLILLTDRPSDLLETITSRCQAVRFDPLPAGAIAERLQSHGVAPEQADACARLALGDAGRALSLALGKGPALRAAADGFAGAALEARMAERPWRALLGAAQDSGRAVVADLESEFESRRETLGKRERRRAETEHEARKKRVQRRAERGTLDLGLALAGLRFRDLACVAWGAPDAIHATDRRGELAESGAGRDAAKLRRAVEMVDDTRARFALNVSDELACEALGYRLERLLA